MALMSARTSVFVSYSSKDSQLANAIYQYLRENGIRALKAPEDIPPGHDWAHSIVEMIHSSSFMILLWTHCSETSKEVSKELTLAMSHGLKIIPFKTTGGNPEGSWRYHLANLQWLDASEGDPSSAFSTLVSQIKQSEQGSYGLDSSAPGYESPESTIPRKTRIYSLIAFIASLVALGLNSLGLIVAVWFGLVKPDLSPTLLNLIAHIYRQIPILSFTIYGLSVFLALFAIRKHMSRRLSILALCLTGFQLLCYFVGGMMGILPR